MPETPQEMVARRKVRQGIVVSDARDKTVTVRIDGQTSHPMYKKTLRRSHKLHVHDEHNDAGVITENPRNRARMMEKRMGKLESMRPELPRAVLHGIADADIGIIGYGANRGPIAEAVQRLAAGGVLTRFLQLRTLWPFPDDDIKEFVRGAQHVFVVENNYTGQLMQLIRAVVGPLDALHGLRKYDGRPFRPIEIIEPIRQMAEVAQDDTAEVI